MCEFLIQQVFTVVSIIGGGQYIYVYIYIYSYSTFSLSFMLSSFLGAQAGGAMVGTGPQVGTVLPGPSCGDSGVSGLGLTWTPNNLPFGGLI